MSYLSQPTHLEALRLRIISQIAEILENQTHTQRYAIGLSELNHNMHQEIVSKLVAAMATMATDDSAAMIAMIPTISQVIDTCSRLDQSLDLLFRQRSQQWASSDQHIQNLMIEFNQTLLELSSVLIEKDLLERQSRVLERIILSHEHISQWKEFVQEILADFYAIFPFNFFYIAFAEANGLSLYLYYLGQCSDEVRAQARGLLSQQMLQSIGLPADSALDIEEFNIHCGAEIKTKTDLNIRMISVPVPDHSPNLAGLLGVAYAAENNLSAQEASVIRAILAVMVMVVGSSKVLSRTLLELEYYAVHDPLTGLHNRRQFNDILHYEIGRSERHKHEFSVLMLDLDDFKDINDSYGHPTGDTALCAIADALLEHTRNGDLCARIGGDEFAIILTETGPEGARVVAENVSRALREMAITSSQGNRFHLTVSIGVSSYPIDGQTIDTLLEGVDAAMYKAKDMGKDSVCTFDATETRVSIRETRDNAENLREALKEGRIVPYYQSIVNCQSGELFAFETLARLKSPTGETTSAAMFIETIDKYGLARELDLAMINNSFAAKRACMDANRPEANAKIFINLSVQEIQGRGILGYAEELCQKLELPPESIVFELLERDAIGDMTNMRRFLTNLRRKGFAFALDDFGTGYNSFHYLRELRFEYVKIDGAFVRNILTSKVDYALVHNLSRLCQDIDILTVAEFVENQEIWEALKDMGINYAQGYHIGMPLPEMKQTLKKSG
ncbi:MULTISPECIES: bifunctional diguanylate cyclase/phosphodiesterase [Methylobacter]|jgi:diguanylate cyclase (GGDEF)-like protein|uniref:Diguanylate cyclase/phosphodiesterase n=1 Tax=Methylobacter tundripaludum TaxID=173365 RepID=A0A2S6HD01_9GAMM|nr:MULTISPECIES: bifunctional diguanylate cyclase/phosphodiesterase [Methylobacter]MDI1278403.1 bifunctional diguanylate cyclase/phosphodiesterase [Methylobacter sp.]MDI1359170.1 bifunctional diguanylate cyclase/phosphodiesterase [Methylobacter sp.]PPK75369.1 diguanylate cyclase/phosphodiesterase [Methylobacter tundripaludum]